MTRRGMLAVAAGAVVAVVLAGAATSPATIVSRAPQIDWNRPSDGGRPLLPPPTVEPFEPERATNHELPAPISIALKTIMVVAATAIVAWLLWVAIRSWRNRPPLHRRQRPVDFDVLDPALVAAAVTADRSAQRAALERGTPRNAIVECWLRLEATIVDAGLSRRESDTSTELVERTLGVHAVDPTAIRRLAALYREARFSTHLMGEGQRRAAITSLDMVHAGLEASVVAADPAVVSAGSGSRPP